MNLPYTDSIKKSVSLIKDVRNMGVAGDTRLCSLDVKDVHTNTEHGTIASDIHLCRAKVFPV
jgi:hypothetical protein